MKITDDVARVLSTLEITGTAARITSGQLDRKLYEKTNAVLEELGGKWNRKARAHAFASDPTARLDEVIEAGEITTSRELGYFATPAGLVADLVRRADVRPGMLALEPSAGTGAIARALRDAGARVVCVEIDKARAGELRAGGYAAVYVDDFLEDNASCLGGPFDRVVMNPPFGKRADLAHVRHAHAMLAPGGRLVSVMSAGVAFREDARAREFRALVARCGGSIAPLPDDSFAASGTRVRTVVATLEAGR